MYRRLRIPPFALLLSIAVVLSSAFTVASIRDAASRETVSEAYLGRPLGYLVLAPISNTLDMLTLLSGRQHVAFVLGLMLLFALWRAARARWLVDGTTARREGVAAAMLLGGILLTYAAAAVLPRPMAALVVDDANLVCVDFHSHTSASHDGRPGWNAERNRAWHRDAGYDVAWVTDHATVSEAERGVANNPSPAGAGVTLLQAIEVAWNGEHVAILGAERTYRGLLTASLHDVDARSVQLASLIANREPVVVWNHPRHLNALPIAAGMGTAGVRAIELSNGAPNDADHVRRERLGILNLVDQKNLAMTSGSDNHGWGSTAPNWTLMLIPGWRGMSADSLATAIEAVIRRGGSRASRVVERRVAEGVRPPALLFTIVGAPARMFTTLSNNERIAWLLWIWLGEAAIWVVRARRRPAPALGTEASH